MGQRILKGMMTIQRNKRILKGMMRIHWMEEMPMAKIQRKMRMTKMMTSAKKRKRTSRKVATSCWKAMQIKNLVTTAMDHARTTKKTVTMKTVIRRRIKRMRRVVLDLKVTRTTTVEDQFLMMTILILKTPLLIQMAPKNKEGEQDMLQV